jgi:hypothetical protein
LTKKFNPAAKETTSSGEGTKPDRYVKNGVLLVQVQTLLIGTEKREQEAIVLLKRFPAKTQVQDVLRWMRNNQSELFKLLPHPAAAKENRKAENLMVIRITWKGGVQEQKTIKLTE